mmetsp:Transcript_40632/g.45783  ORF Transcript_40632/g.45783 Transcript_40632/m.45783 type:complete len:206 (+) Transcript_40632:455-1072(+)
MVLSVTDPAESMDSTIRIISSLLSVSVEILPSMVVSVVSLVVSVAPMLLFVSVCLVIWIYWVSVAAPMLLLLLVSVCLVLTLLGGTLLISVTGVSTSVSCCTTTTGGATLLVSVCLVLTLLGGTLLLSVAGVSTSASCCAITTTTGGGMLFSLATIFSFSSGMILLGTPSSSSSLPTSSSSFGILGEESRVEATALLYMICSSSS